MTKFVLKYDNKEIERQAQAMIQELKENKTLPSGYFSRKYPSAYKKSFKGIEDLRRRAGVDYKPKCAKMPEEEEAEQIAMIIYEAEQNEKLSSTYFNKKYPNAWKDGFCGIDDLRKNVGISYRPINKRMTEEEKAEKTAMMIYELQQDNTRTSDYFQKNYEQLYKDAFDNKINNLRKAAEVNFIPKKGPKNKFSEYLESEKKKVRKKIKQLEECERLKKEIEETKKIIKNL